MPRSHRFSCLWSLPYSPAQGSSRGREKPRNVGESDLKPNQPSPVRRAPPTPSLQRDALWQTDFKAHSAPFLSHTLLNTQALSLPDTHTLRDKRDHSTSWCASQYCLFTSHSPHNRLAGQQTGTCSLLSFLIFVSTHQTLPLFSKLLQNNSERKH